MISYLTISNENSVKRFKDRLNSLDKTKQYKIQVDEYVPIRSLSQNKYLFGVVYKLIAKEVGSDVDSVHFDLKNLFGIKQQVKSIITNKIEDRIKSTSKYTSQEMTNYIDSIKNWAITFLGITIPDSNSDAALYIYNNKF